MIQPTQQTSSAPNAVAAQAGLDARPVVLDAAYADACGPISCFVAARALGLDTTLDDMAARCDFRGSAVSLSSMERALVGTGSLDVDPVHLQPGELLSFLEDGDGVAILVVEQDGTSETHAVTAVDGDASGVLLIDYPRLTTRREIDALCDIWSGEALLITRSPNLAWPELAASLPVTTCILALSLILCARDVLRRWRGGVRGTTATSHGATS